jgi:hypothetical protein
MIPNEILKMLFSPDIFKTGVESILLVILVVSNLYNNFHLQNKLIRVIENNTKAVSKVETVLTDCKNYKKELELKEHYEKTF